MIFEYAVDPDLVRHWQVFRHIADGLGFGRGRIISRYPRDSFLLAYRSAENLDDNTKKKVVTWLADRAKRAMSMPRAGAAQYSLPTWFENATAEHERNRFHAIVADQPPSQDPPVLRFSEIDEADPLWAVETQQYIPRIVAEVVKRTAPLLAHANSIRFIGPYFKGDPDQLGILIDSLCLAVRSGKSNVTSIELHVDGQQVKPSTETFMMQALNNRWPTGLPTIKIVRWRLDYLHNRFILTDRGGIMFGDSLKKHESRPDQMTLLEEGVRAKWWKYHDSKEFPRMVYATGEIL